MTTSQSLAKKDLSRVNLATADLAGADLHEATLHDATLMETNLEGADLTEADLTHANLAGASLNSATAAHANFERADLRDADLTGANLRGARLAGAKLREHQRGVATAAGAELDDTNFEDTNDRDHGALLNIARLSRRLRTLPQEARFIDPGPVVIEGRGQLWLDERARRPDRRCSQTSQSLTRQRCNAVTSTSASFQRWHGICEDRR